jgi:RNA polymerase sigma-70 factor (ECF subfamily)
MHTTPPSLLQRLRQPGAQDAWVRFVKLYTPLIYNWARRKGLQEQDATDLVQEVFAVVFQKMPRFHYDPNRSFRGWLHTITIRRWKDFLRHKQVRPEILAAEMSHLPGPPELDEFAEVEYRRYVVSRALTLMQTDFAPTTWKACWEHVVADRPAAEVAAELGISENAVYVAKSRVLRRLREELAEIWD